jgi:hypothetical protein
MKLDRNILGNGGRGKYALLLLRNVDAADSKVSRALETLEDAGVLDWGDAKTEREFMVIRLKDKYARAALLAYAEEAQKEDAEYAAEIYGLASRSGELSEWCKKPD